MPTVAPRPIYSDIPARLDALPWSRFHTFIVVALGITWVLDGLEVTLAGAVGSALKNPAALGLSDGQVGFSATCYLAGAVAGALLFGYATDRFGRKKLFFVTLLLYVAATGATAFSWNAWSYFAFRFLTGAGIGGEYAAINSAIDELIPARVRGHVDLLINATFWLGAALGSGVTLFLLDPARFAVGNGWRYAFGVGAVLGLVIVFLRNSVPESPRWLMIHGRENEAERTVAAVEQRARETAYQGQTGEPPSHQRTEIYPRDHTPWRDIFHVMLVEHRTRSLLGFALMVSQAFFYNAVGFFTYTLILDRFFGVPPARVSYYLLPFAFGNALGPVVLGRWFDTWGRKPMIIATYAGAAVLLAATAVMFDRGELSAISMTALFTGVFFIASCAASSAYLTVSEIFPLEMRGIAIAIFYALGTLVGGVAAPAIFGHLIASGSRTEMLAGFLVAAGFMLAGAGTEALFGVNAEGKSLEAITQPISSARPSTKR